MLNKKSILIFGLLSTFLFTGCSKKNKPVDINQEKEPATKNTNVEIVDVPDTSVEDNLILDKLEGVFLESYGNNKDISLDNLSLERVDDIETDSENLNITLDLNLDSSSADFSTIIERSSANIAQELVSSSDLNIKYLFFNWSVNNGDEIVAVDFEVEEGNIKLLNIE